MNKSATVVAVQFPKDLVRRSKAVSKIFQIATAQIIRDGFRIRVEELEEKFRQEEAIKERAHVKLEAQRMRFADRMAPVNANFDKPLRSERRDDLSRDDSDHYDELARHVYTAGDDVEEMRKRAKKAVEEVQRRHPLLPPSESEILMNLESRLLRLREEGAKKEAEHARTVDGLVGTVLDTSKIETHGHTED